MTSYAVPLPETLILYVTFFSTQFCYVYRCLFRSQVEIEIKKRMKAEAAQDHLVRI